MLLQWTIKKTHKFDKEFNLRSDTFYTHSKWVYLLAKYLFMRRHVLSVDARESHKNQNNYLIYLSPSKAIIYLHVYARLHLHINDGKLNEAGLVHNWLDLTAPVHWHGPRACALSVSSWDSSSASIEKYRLGYIEVHLRSGPSRGKRESFLAAIHSWLDFLSSCFVCKVCRSN